MHVIFSMLISFHLPLPILFSASAHFSPSIYLLNILISFSYAKVHKYSPSLFFWFSLLSLSLSSLNEQKVAAKVFSQSSLTVDAAARTKGKLWFHFWFWFRFWFRFIFAHSKASLFKPSWAGHSFAIWIPLACQHVK